MWQSACIRRVTLGLGSNDSCDYVFIYSGISSGGLDLGHTSIEGQQRHIEGSTSEIEDEHLGGLVLVQAIETVRQSGGGRLVDDAENIKASNAAGGLGGSALRVVEVRRHGDDGFVDGPCECRGQDQSRDR